MGEISISVERIGRCEYCVAQKNGKDYVAMVNYRNTGKNIAGKEPWYQTIKFMEPDSIDELIELLTYLRMRVRYDLYLPTDKHEGVLSAVHRAGNEFTARKVNDGWECEACGEVTSTKYKKPKVCPNCGAYFDKYLEDE